MANCLTGEARSLLNELDHEGKRDYNTLVEKLRNRFGSVNKSEIYRTQIKSRTRNKGETIPELAQAIKKMVRQAYPGVNKEVIETLSLDHFIDAITDADIRLRLREAGPKSLAEAEQIAVRIEAYKIADKQRTRLVGRVDCEGEKTKDEKSKSPDRFESLTKAISTLTNKVENIKGKMTVVKVHFSTTNRSHGTSVTSQATTETRVIRARTAATKTDGIITGQMSMMSNTGEITLVKIVMLNHRMRQKRQK